MPTISPPGLTPKQAKLAKLNRRLAVGSLLLLILPFVAMELTSIPSRQRHAQLQALENTLANGRRIWFALEKFRKTYGRYPDATTAAMVKERTGSTWNLKADTANDVFRQLIAAGVVDSELIFQALGQGMHKPDGRMKAEAEALQPGECGFAYIDGPSSGNTGRPMVVAPLIHGTHRFDRSIWDGLAVVVRGDGSAVHNRLRPDGTWSGPDGLDLCDPILWDGQTAVVKWPDSRRPSWFQRYGGWSITASVTVIVVGFLTIYIARKHRKFPPGA
ncbi:hypothetical protein KBB96_18210 [Luteolibacter ambystomatis]|uniref:Uncharacterized protein n=1 Tax=Luteolibacter ambystomatis TaxID=2824561 RepID=A0A975G8J0_9BACT|nr:hypothetical protein [Luteolibacter ambystomatis]QUE50782.1 hypothetical protein KBB96_18210 [Luteolibacter ambystomatis]